MQTTDQVAGEAREKLAKELEARFAGEGQSFAQLAIFTKACLPVILAALRAQPERGAEEMEDRLDACEEALYRIKSWSEAYPLTVFPEPDLKKARALLEAGGMTLDSLSAHAMRHAVEGVGRIARRALPPSGKDDGAGR